MEIELAKYFNPRINIIVPNVWWGMGINHECDMMVMTPCGYAYEVEIKVDKYDLIKDKNKPHEHSSKKIKRLYFAITEDLEPYINHIPDHSGILVVRANKFRSVKKIRESKVINNYKYSKDEMFALTKLGTMRIFGLKEKINSSLKTESIPRPLNHENVLDYIGTVTSNKDLDELERYIVGLRGMLTCGGKDIKKFIPRSDYYG